MLPDWIELPAPRPFATIHAQGGLFAAEGSDGEVIAVGIDIYDIYARTSNNYNLEITAAAKAAGNVQGDEDFMLSVPTDDGMLLAMIIINDMERWDMLQGAFHDAVANIRAYRDEPSLSNAYNMLDTHPAFWTRVEEEPTWNWQIDGHVQNLRFFLAEGEWMMEAGSHTPGFTGHYYDPRLDVYGDTFEDCLLAMAAKVDKFFHEDGTEREGVEYEKSKLELLLEGPL